MFRDGAFEGLFDYRALLLESRSVYRTGSCWDSPWVYWSLDMMLSLRLCCLGGAQCLLFCLAHRGEP